MKSRKVWHLLPLGAALFVLAVLAVSVRTSTGRPALGQRGQPAPDLALVTLEGKPWSLGEQRGKVVLLNFWATWCPPCRMETPGLVKLAKDYSSKGLVVAGVSMDDGGAEPVRQFASDFRVPYWMLLPGGDSAMLNEISSLPTTVFIDREGRIAKTFYGAMPEEVFREEADRLLEQR